MELPVAVVERRLAEWPVGRLASVGPDGAPHQVPVVFARVGGSLWTPVDGKPKAGRELVRLRNLRARPRASLLLDSYTADWTRLWWIRVDARVRILQPERPDRDATFATAVGALRAKYPQYADLPVTPSPATLIELEIVGARSWCASAAAARV